MSRISESLSRRISNLSFLAALLVVPIHLGHLPQQIGTAQWFVIAFVRNALAVTAVPFFFLVSGFFLARHVGESHWWRNAVQRRLSTLGIPYLVWCLVPFVLFTFLWPVDNPTGECSRTALKASSIAAAFGLNLFTLPEASRPMWYVRALFFFFLASPLIAALVRRWKLGALVFLWVLYWLVNPGLCNSPDFWVSIRWQVVTRFTFSLEGLFYFAAGLYLADHSLAISRRTATWLGTIGIALGAVALVIKSLGGTDFGYLTSASIPLTLCLLWSWTPDWRLPSWLVGNSFALYVIHPVVLTILSQVAWLSETAVDSFFEWVLCVSFSLALAGLLRHTLPRLSSLSFGGR